MHDAAKDSYDDSKHALGKSGRPPRRSSRRRGDGDSYRSQKAILT